MPRPCTICTDPRLEAVDQAILEGRPVLRVADEYAFSESSLRRHKNRHLAPRLAAALQRRDDLDGDMLVGWAADLHARTLVLLGRAEAARDWAAARGFLAEARRNVELLGRMTGLLDGPAVSIDMRRQVAVLAKLDEDELRALARAAAGAEEEPERYQSVVTLPAIPHGEGELGASG